MKNVLKENLEIKCKLIYSFRVFLSHLNISSVFNLTLETRDKLEVNDCMICNFNTGWLSLSLRIQFMDLLIHKLEEI